jgi:hypothetical protein
MNKRIFIGHGSPRRSETKVGLNTDETRIFVPQERRKLASYEVAGTARQTIAS